MWHVSFAFLKDSPRKLENVEMVSADAGVINVITRNM
jgi:hypothetical protein